MLKKLTNIRMCRTVSALHPFCAPAPGADGICGSPVVWFDYELGKRNPLQGFVYPEHRVSNRAEKLAL
jgi:hypothetical protein